MTSLTKYLIENGEFVEPGKGDIFSVTNETHFWIIDSGKVDLFLQQFPLIDSSGQKNPLYHIGRLETGQLFLGHVFESGENWQIIARNCSHTRVYTAPLKILENLPKDLVPELCKKFDEWIKILSAKILFGKSPKRYLEPGYNGENAITIASEDIVSVPRGVRWFALTKGSAYVMSDTSITINANDAPVPICATSWIEAANESQLIDFSTEQIFASGKLVQSAHNFFNILFRFILESINNNVLLDNLLMFDRIDINHQSMYKAIEELADALESKSQLQKVIQEQSSDTLYTALSALSNELNISFVPLDTAYSGTTFELKLYFLCTKAKVGYRRVRLDGKWFLEEHGAFLGFLKGEGKHPIAMLPDGVSGYIAFDPVSKTTTKINEKNYLDYSDEGYVIIQSFPYKKISVIDMAKLSFLGLWREIGLIIVASIFASALGLISPIFTKILFDNVIPNSDKLGLMQIVAGLIMVAIVTALIQLFNGFVLLRLETKVELRSQAAFWQRILTLPITFFNKYTTGDLLSRAGGFQSIQTMISGPTLSGLLTSIFGLSSVIILFAYAPGLAVFAIFYGIGVQVLLAACMAYQMRFQRKIQKQSGKLNGVLGELVKGMEKLRTAGAETRAYAHWAKEYAYLRKLSVQAQMLAGKVGIINLLIPNIGLVVIYTSITYMTGDESFTTGKFVAFLTAFNQFTGSIAAISGTLMSLITIFPTWERLKPILDELPETRDNAEDPGEIKGKVEVSRVYFKYSKDGPLILNNICFDVAPGEFVAIVGTSGSGKSTLLKLLLHFEEPIEGRIYIDGKDTATLDLDLLRKNYGVVLQDGQLIPGSIFDNVDGGAGLSTNQVWEALEHAQLAEAIEKMPMQLNTIVGMGGAGISGGQRQRLLIARALAQNPKILILDEATSALDNNTQAEVMKHLEKIKLTRIVVAHRLSTVINADKIIVMEKGKIVETGTYEELMLNQGTFSKLAQAQIA